MSCRAPGAGIASSPGTARDRYPSTPDLNRMSVGWRADGSPPRGGVRRRVVPAWLRGGLDALEDAQLLGFELRLQLVLDRGEPGEENRIALVDRQRRDR